MRTEGKYELCGCINGKTNCDYLHTLVKSIGEQWCLFELKMVVTGLMKQVVCIHN